MKRLISIILSFALITSSVSVVIAEEPDAETYSIEVTDINGEYSFDDLENMDEDFLQDVFYDAVDILQNENIDKNQTETTTNEDDDVFLDDEETEDTSLQDVEETEADKDDINEEQISTDEIVNEDTTSDGILSDSEIGLMSVSDTDVAYPVEGGNIYFNESNKTITGYDGTPTSITIPEKINGVSVEIIASAAFANNSYLTNIELPESITTLGVGFIGGTNITEIRIPKNVTKSYVSSNTAAGALSGCKSLKKVVFEDGITKIPDYIASFYITTKDPSNISEVVIPSTVKEIGTAAFRNCTNLCNISLPEGIEIIGGNAFSNTGLTNIELPESTTTLGVGIIGGTNITEIRIPKNVTKSYLGSNTAAGALSGCESLKKVIFEDGITKIPDYIASFYITTKDPSNISEVVIPSTVKEIGASAFRNCTNLCNISLPEGIEIIGSNAFSNTGLTNIELPESTTTLGVGIIGGTNITEIKIPKNVTTVYTSAAGVGALSGCESLKKVVFEDGITKIPDYMASFYITTKDPSNISEVVIPSTVKEIGASAFRNCTNLKKILIPESVTKIASDSFYGCDKDKLVMYVKPNSYALEYAIANNFLYNTSADTYKNYSQIVNNIDWKYNKEEGEESSSNSKSINSIGVNSNSFVNQKSDKDTLHGPKITIMNKSFYLFDLPIDMSIKTPIGSVKYNSKDEKYEVMLGKLDKTALAGKDDENKTYNEIKEFVNYCGKKTTTSTWNNYQHLQKVLKSQDTDIGFSFNATPAGYMEFDKNKKILEGSIVYVLNMDANIKKPIAAAPFIYIKVGFGIDALGKFGIKSVATNSYAVFGSFSPSLSPYVGIGTGSAKIANAEVGAKIKLAANVEVATNKKIKDIFSASITGSLYLKVKILSYINFEKPWDLTKVSLYPDFGAELLSLDDYGSMVVMPRNYIGETSEFVANSNDDISLMGIDNIDISTFKTNIYPYSEPQLAKLKDGREILVWIDDDLSRNDINCSVLKYSINNGSSWSEPADIYNNGTADFSPRLAVTSSGAAIVWQKANKTFSNDTSLDTMAQSMDLYYSEFDGTSWNEAIKITDDNANYEFGADIASNGSEVTVTWMENSANDYFALTGTNTVYKKVLNNSWKNSEVVSNNLACITNLMVSYIDNDSVIAYTEDQDGNVETSDDIELYEYYQNDLHRMTDDSIVDYAVTKTDDGYMWIHDEQILKRNSDGIDVVKLPINPTILNNVKLLSNGSDNVVVWEQSDDYASELYAIYYDNLDKSWGEPVQLTNSGMKIRESNGYLNSDGSIRLAFGQAEIDENSNEIYGKCNLMLSNITGKIDVVVNDAGCVYNDYISGSESTIWASVVNNSSSKVEKFNFKVTDKNKVVVDETVTKEIISGGSDIIEVPYTLPDDLSNNNYKVTITPIGVNDEDLSNNSTSFEMGFSDIVTTAEFDNNKLKVTIQNNGYLDADNVVCNLISENTIIETKTIGSMTKGQIYKCDFDIKGEDWITIKVNTDSDENSYSNNDVYLNLAGTENIGTYIALGECVFENNSLKLNITTVNDSNTKTNATIIAAVYKDDELYKYCTIPVTLQANDSKVVEKIISNADDSIDEIKLFIWDTLEEMKPYSDKTLISNK